MVLGRIFTIGDYEVEPLLNEIRARGAVTKIEPRAMRVLERLAEHPGEVVSVQELLDAVWKDVVVTENSVYTAIGALRRALGDDGETYRYIANVPRRGYRLIAPVATAPTPQSLAPATLAPVVTAPPPGTASPRKVRLTRLVIGALLLAAIALGWALYRGYAERPEATTQKEVAVTGAGPKSIAVLPFLDVMGAPDQAYLGAGIADAVRTLLAQIPGTVVIGANSSVQAATATTDARDAGARLGVSYVVTGTVRRSPERLRITANLIEVHTGAYRWSENFDRPAGDWLTVNDTIAAEVAHALEIGLGADRQSRHESRSKAAYELYLRGRYAEAREDSAGLAAAVAYLREAVSLDPEFVDAIVALAEAYYWQAINGLTPTDEAYDLALDIARSALALDPNVGLAHAIVGAVYSDRNRDWAAAEKEFKTALAIAPRDGIVIRLAAQLPLALGHDEAAMKLFQESLVYDPFLADSWQLLAWVELRSGRLNEAEAAARRAIEVAPRVAWGHFFLGSVLLFRDDLPSALREMRLETHPAVREEGLALVYHAMGNRAESDAALVKFVRLGGDLVPTDVARVHAYRDNPAEAFVWLDHAQELHDPGLFMIKGDPYFSRLTADPRFAAFLRKIKLPG